MTAAKPIGAPALARSGQAETLSSQAGAIALLLDSSHAAGALSAQRVRLPPGGQGAVPHHHLRSTELFFTIAGSAQLLAGERILTLGPGDTVAVPPRMTHAFAAAPERDVDLLIIITPGVERFGYFRHLAGVMAGELPADGMLTVQERYDTYFEECSVWERRRSGR
jgi:mannose-6-phosphate isomerase-like protein (cupin superfamily)